MEQQDFPISDQSGFYATDERNRTNQLIQKQNEHLEKILHILYTQYQSPRRSYDQTKVIDLKMSFGSMLLLRLKWQLASWLAFLIIAPIIGALIFYLTTFLTDLDIPFQISEFILKYLQ